MAIRWNMYLQSGSTLKKMTEAEKRLETFETVEALRAHLRSGKMLRDRFQCEERLFELCVSSPNAKVYCDDDNTVTLYVKQSGGETEVQVYEELD